ncbi:putative calcineurin binding protein [Aspergillus clavatus NRRL 1]|uniref:Calcineurin binding protein, putative n=1 Tax=Aspergillus clavatus (strain ATCC 1007 / CBS 513.65 / DSM 816 / NCTC 3887 / NRRL 1 / QM 1276 / 107) TaxID=344612 RepID=A1C6Y4_ASPCL|nr:calcineurin binding protein, putative [Aspergillus clavatus NRRL 1]EAW14155.1 calcineurin binding protein, putative [Aspergillus clavatus NRRL 1]
MAGLTTSPPSSLPSSPSFSAHRASNSSSPRPALSLDLSNLPPPSQPTPPSNTLLITELQDLYLFQPSSLASIREQIAAIAPLNSFSPLPSMRRIVCSFLSQDDALRVRKLLDGQPLLSRNVRTKIYFGEPTPILDEESARRPKLLEAPHLDKLFFISPPPSPPHGWVLRTEEPPNKEVHATDLAHALAQLKTDQVVPAAAAIAPADPDTPLSITSDKRTCSWPASMSGQRSRSSTLIYHPEDHGGSPGLPAVMVEDMSAPLDDGDVEMSPIEMCLKKMPPKTSRPPVELML